MPVASGAGRVERRSGSETDSLPINEVFYSLQGEGKFTGTPSMFIRTSGCNLRCWFCDSFHTSWEPQGDWLEVDDIVQKVQNKDDVNHIVLTGGEPMMHDESVELLDRFSELGYHTTVETNGTIYRDTSIDLASISPKLASSTPTPERNPTGETEWAEKHEERRIDLDALAKLVDSYESQLKFVVTGPEDMEEIETLLDRVRKRTQGGIENEHVLLMPEGRTREELGGRRQVVAELAMKHGYRYTPRLHVDMWNDAPGT